MSSVTPNARRTQEGSRDSLVQAEPELTAQCFMAISKLSPSTKAKDILILPQQRWLQSPFSSTWVMRVRIPSKILWQSRSVCLASLTISLWATQQALPRPTTRGVGRVPDLNPRSCPPPLMRGAKRTLGFLLRKSAPTPLGPYILCPLMLMRSMFILLTSISILPTACAASVWRNILCSRQSLPISSIFCLTPISLCTRMTLTQSTFSFDYRIVFFSNSTSRMPFFCTGRYVTLKPSSSKCRQVSSMHLCSIWVVMICFRSFPQNLARPFSTILLDSVAPDVKIISFGSALIRVATCSRAESMAFEESQPNLCVLEWGFPQKSVRYGIMASRTRQSMGVVAWQSKYCTFPVEKAKGARGSREEALSIMVDKCFMTINQFIYPNFHIILVKQSPAWKSKTPPSSTSSPRVDISPQEERSGFLCWLCGGSPFLLQTTAKVMKKAFMAASDNQQQRYLFQYEVEDVSALALQALAQSSVEKSLRRFAEERGKGGKRIQDR